MRQDAAQFESGDLLHDTCFVIDCCQRSRDGNRFPLSWAIHDLYISYVLDCHGGTDTGSRYFGKESADIMNRTGKGTENLHMTSDVIPVSGKRRWAALLWTILLAALLIHGIANRGGLNMDQRLFSTRNIVQVPVNAENVGSTVITGKGWNTSSISVRVRIPETADITEDSQLELTLFETDGTMLTDSYAPIPEDTTDAVVNITLSPSPVMLEKGTPYQLVLSVTSGTVNVCCSAETSDILYVMHADSLAEKLYLKGILTVILILMAIQGILLLYELLRGSRFFILLSLAGFFMNTLASRLSICVRSHSRIFQRDEDGFVPDFPADLGEYSAACILCRQDSAAHIS